MIDGSEIKADEPIGNHPETGEPIFILTGRFGPYVQLGETPEKGSKKEKPRRASIPQDKSVEDVTLEDAVKYLMLPRELGGHPDTGVSIVANTGRFGPYVEHAGDYRSLKGEDNPYDITFDRALELLKEPKKGRPGEKMVKELGLHPKTNKLVRVYESKSGQYLRKGFKRIMLPDGTNLKTFTVEDAVELLKQN
jgi:DNA topoisomerase-1